MDQPEEDRNSIKIVEGIASTVVPEGFLEKGLEISMSDDKQPDEAEPQRE